MITKTEAIVLKSMKYRDTSKIVTFYTRRFGKLKGIAKGARQMRSKFGAALEPLSQVALVFYKKEQRDLHLVSQCDSLKTYKNIPNDLERTAVALAVLELVNQLAHEQEENERLYLLIAETLDAIELAPTNTVNLFFAFELRCAALLGFSPDFDRCFSCGRSLDPAGAEASVVFNLSKGGFLCATCLSAGDHRAAAHATRDSNGGASQTFAGNDEGRIRVSVSALKALSYLLHARLETVAALDLGSVGGNEIDGTLRLYMRQHFEDLKPVKSLDMLKNTPALGQ